MVFMYGIHEGVTMEILKTALVAIVAVWVYNKIINYAQLPADLKA